VTYSYGGDVLFDAASDSVTTLHVSRAPLEIVVGALVKRFGESVGCNGVTPVTLDVDVSRLLAACLPLASKLEAGRLVGEVKNGDHPTFIRFAHDASSPLTDAGTYPLTASDAEGPGMSNYAIVYRAGQVIVLPADLRITADDETMESGDPVPTLTATYAGFVNGNTPADLDTPVALTTTATSNSAPGTYPITPSGASDHNYTVSFVAGTLTVADTKPPVITASATPTSLWPASGRPVVVTVSGRMTDGGSGINPASARFNVVDEYGALQPTGPIAVGANGSYSFTLPLVASRLGSDVDGRRYEIGLSVSDAAGNNASTMVVVIVPHDQAK
jgi:hypothetical protein